MARAAFLFAAFVIAFSSRAHAGNEAVNRRLGGPTELWAPSFEAAAEVAYLWGAIANPNSYEAGAFFLTGRWRWGIIEREGWLRGYNQVYFLLLGQPIFRGPESYYWGISAGMRYNFVQPGSRLVPYVSGGVGLGWLDSHAEVFGAQGQDFTFNILSAAGVTYQVNDRLKVSVGALYEHLSNAGQTSPNPSLNMFGPQIGVTWSW
ncbi:MAG TPA: acyloxyacyl hydrolase [Chthoniobacterales bacterium]|nr:acyloxyacyl hydrolase [Chthoniobacterales bacterium]